MNLAKAAKRHEELAVFYARIGKAKTARLHVLRADQLEKAKELKRECRHVAR